MGCSRRLCSSSHNRSAQPQLHGEGGHVVFEQGGSMTKSLGLLPGQRKSSKSLAEGRLRFPRTLLVRLQLRPTLYDVRSFVGREMICLQVR